MLRSKEDEIYKYLVIGYHVFWMLVALAVGFA
jgi:hypothetical protein